jgi:hypothetical protein
MKKKKKKRSTKKQNMAAPCGALFFFFSLFTKQKGRNQSLLTEGPAGMTLIHTKT